MNTGVYAAHLTRIPALKCMYFLPANTEDTNAASMQLYLNVLQIRRRKNTNARTHRQSFNSTQSEENYNREAVRSDCSAEWSNSIDEECFTWQDRKTSKVSISSSSSPMNTKECVARRKYKTQVFLLRKNLQPPMDCTALVPAHEVISFFRWNRLTFYD